MACETIRRGPFIDRFDRFADLVGIRAPRDEGAGVQRTRKGWRLTGNGAKPSLAAAIAAVLGSGELSLTIALFAVFWAPLARVTYGQAVVIRERPFVEAARSLGASNGRIMLVEVLPHVWPVVVAYAALSVGWAGLFESALGFLGVGIQEPTASIGSMLGSGLPFYRSHPGLVAFPALYLGLLVTGCTLIGEGLRRPRRKDAGVLPVAQEAVRTTKVA